MSNLKRIYFYKDNFSKIVFIVLIIILIIVPDFTSAELFLDNDKQNIEEKSRIIFLVNSLTSEEVIKADIIAQNNHDLEIYFSLRTMKIYHTESKDSIMIFKERYPEYDILRYINKAELMELKEIPFYLIGNIRKMEEYITLYSQIKVYYVCINYYLKSESQYIFSGVNYLLYILIFEKENWLINEISEPCLNQIIETGYGFGTLEEEKALQIQTAKYEADGKKINLPIPNAPILSFVYGEKSFIQINWNWDIADYFNIYRATTPSGPWEKIISSFPKIAHTAVDYNYPKNIEVLYYRITSTDKKLNESKPSEISLIKITQE
jgi:hypothetical protein